MYKVVNTFKDKDGSFYNKRDVYPHDGIKLPSKARLKELSTKGNKCNMVFIEEVKGNDTRGTEAEAGEASEV